MRPLAERAALVALLRERPGKRSWPELTALVIEWGSAQRLRDTLSRPGEPMLDLVLDQEAAEADGAEQAASDIVEWERAGLTVLTVLDHEYPARLRGIHEAPPLLFARGALLEDDTAVSVVGSRKASPAGLDLARDIAAGLVDQGITVIAGLALGIDTAAHQATLEAGGRTVAVIGTGINQVYPAPNRELHQVIARRGLLLSQFWPDAPPQKHTFLMRNATMSGYGIATVVVEAGETSGARAQARMAVEHGRPVLLTDLVVDRNQWAKALVGRPGVHVIDKAGAAVEVVTELRDARTKVAGRLALLASV